MIRDQETLNILLDTISRFVRERLVPPETLVAETDQIPQELVDECACSASSRARARSSSSSSRAT